MCDTFVALGNSTLDGNVVFGKNSDRLDSEPQLITFSPRKKYSNGETLKCTHISIPQVSETASILLSQPYWMWGAEMGANEYNVVIGNEAVATKEPLRDTGLLGMDILRLCLERSKTAKEALNIAINLLETHGQGGIHNQKGLKYHNSFIISDPKEAFVLEAAGEWWIVENVKDFRSISNNISIRGKGDLRKKGIIQHAIDKGYCKDDNHFDFKMVFSSSPLPEVFPLNSRDGCSLNQLGKNKGKIIPEIMMNFLREHDVGICMHGRNSQSTGSQVSHLKSGNKKSIHWFTGGTIPCLNVFKPYAFPVDNQKVLSPGPYEAIDPNWFWAKHTEFVKPYKGRSEKPEKTEYMNKLKSIEMETIHQINELVEQEKDLSDSTFIEKLTSIQLSTWNKSFEMISNK